MRRASRRRLLRFGLAGGTALGVSAAARTTPAQSPHDPGETRISRGRVRPGSDVEILGDGGDTTALWVEALASVAAAGGGTVRASGEHQISDELLLPDGVAVEITGVGRCVLRKADPGREFRLFTNAASAALRADLVIANLHFEGDWDARPSMGGDASRCIALRGYRRVLLRGLSATGFRNMTFTADDCDEVLVDGCRVQRSARDPINLTGSRFVKVVNCTIQHAWDDAIAIHVPRGVTSETQRYAAIVANNQILQANGIKVLGGREVTIAGNQILAPNNYGIYLGHDDFWNEGGAPHRNVLVVDNIVTEPLLHAYLPGQGAVDTGILVTDPGRAVFATRISGNIVSKFKPAGQGVHYSDWGLGADARERRLFTAGGWTDPELTAGHQGRGIGIRIIAANADDENAIAIAGNTVVNFAHDIERLVR